MGSLFKFLPWRFALVRLLLRSFLWPNPSVSETKVQQYAETFAKGFCSWSMTFGDNSGISIQCKY